MRVCVLGMFFMLLLARVYAQQDSVRLLPEVSVEAQRAVRYAAGAKISRPDSSDIQNLQGKHLSEVLGQFPGVAIRSYGAGMVSSISFRGTGANHTRIVWNGINLNQPTLGQSDLSLVPLAAVEDIQVQYGGASALQGSDALGGVVYLQSAIPSFHPQTTLGISSGIASFQTYQWLVKAQLSDEKWFVQAKAYRHQSANTFSFLNSTRISPRTEVQENAQWHNQGANLDVFRQIGKRTVFSLKSWYHQTDRQIQPSMVINGRENQYTTQWDESLRTVAELSVQASNKQLHTASLAQVYDHLWYNQRSHYYTYQWVGNYHIEQHLGTIWWLRTGLSGNHITVHSDAFTEVKQELRSDAYASLSVYLTPSLRISANLRQTLLDGYQPSPAPSLGLEGHWPRKGSWQWTSRAQVSRSYRLPTFNERYWPTGNPAIRPEIGLNAELGSRGAYHSDLGQFETDFSLYASRVKDWVIWQNSSLGPSPANIQEVGSHGFEYLASYSHSFKTDLQGRISGQYAYTRAIILSENSNQHNQLPYVPIHAASGRAQIAWRQFEGQWESAYTGYRFYSASNDGFVAPFMLSHFQLAYSHSLGKYTARARFRIDNLFDVAYQNIRYLAMPGRSFALHYHVFFTQKP
ncbi:TonB-dependent receptor plug domain-containing protein [Cytophagales bacterium LB-30]|uniref:TonB-dependent receptor plug domain-containing protein n=1 Tax=Shiella aurantiaca TaxID=3058365 RepID=A0ABT8F7E4_9BACT|nr:TonB-dependent receptor plug domain-containing protein [Shiella aurantiaca]MDN4166294.1 TonB-dependent receptor plug domain-containing protein [Shiella aurantiaca]